MQRLRRANETPLLGNGKKCLQFGEFTTAHRRILMVVVPL
jgi:hypothetical protein